MAALTDKKALTLSAAKSIAGAAEAAATSMNVPVVISIMDDGANLLYLQRMDGAPLGSVVVSQDKSRSSVLFKTSTKDYETWLAGGLTAMLKLDALPFEGGIPLVSGGQVVGAIGISGGTAPQDGQIALAGVSWLTSQEQ
ncbi:MAG: heme-binding protein [Acidobacteriia bacterium]|jgi:hypothetical protein|nr:heme-binding protein [Terriglobia bacterium]